MSRFWTWTFRAAGLAAALAGLYFWSWRGDLWTDLGVHSPLAPNPSAGQIAPLRFRSVVVYVTQAEASLLAGLLVKTWVCTAVWLVASLLPEVVNRVRRA